MSKQVKEPVLARARRSVESFWDRLENLST